MADTTNLDMMDLSEMMMMDMDLAYTEFLEKYGDYSYAELLSSYESFTDSLHK